MIKIRIADPKSQKARGAQVLASSGGLGWLSTENIGRARLISFASSDPTQVDWARLNYPAFARPCPTRPRHGFVDSRVISTDMELLTMINEIRDSGEDTVEILICEPIAAEWSAIWTPTSLTIGPGNDGATSGHGAVTIPLVSTERTLLDSDRYRTNAGITNTTYVEIVSDGKTTPEVVQLRDGPAVPYDLDYIPEDVTVRAVVWADGDLLEWEQRCKSFEPGTVVYHPGGSLASHYAVHCVINSIPVICSATVPPQIGKKLRAIKRAARLTRDHHTEIARALAEFFHRSVYSVDSARQYLEVAFAVLHNLTLLDLRIAAHRNLYAFGIATMIKCATALLAGEMRHYTSSGPGRYGSVCPIKGISRGDHGRRHQIYAKYLRHATEYSAVKLPQLRRGFRQRGWSSAFGGGRWAECAEITEKLIAAVSVYLTEKRDRDHQLAEIAGLYNNLVHAVHNGGRLFNKLLSTSIMDEIARWPVRGLLNNAAWEIISVQPSATRYPRAVGARLLKSIKQGAALAEVLFEEEPQEAPDGTVQVDPSTLDWAGAQFKPKSGKAHFQIPKITKVKYTPPKYIPANAKEYLDPKEYPAQANSYAGDSTTIYYKCPLTYDPDGTIYAALGWTVIRFTDVKFGGCNEQEDSDE